MKRAIVFVLIAAVGGGTIHFAADDNAAVTVPVAAPLPRAEPPAAVLPQAPPTAAAQAPYGDGLQRVPLAPVDTRAPAWIPLAQAREAGDARTPPLQRESADEPAAPEILGDPQAYAAYQLAQKQRLAAAYVQAAGPELARLQGDLELGRAAGIAPEELARVAEKIRRLEQQRQAAAGR